jgi:hypothetical protein
MRRCIFRFPFTKQNALPRSGAGDFEDQECGLGVGIRILGTYGKFWQIAYFIIQV